MLRTALVVRSKIFSVAIFVLPVRSHIKHGTVGGYLVFTAEYKHLTTRRVKQHGRDARALPRSRARIKARRILAVRDNAYSVCLFGRLHGVTGDEDSRLQRLIFKRRTNKNSVDSQDPPDRQFAKRPGWAFLMGEGRHSTTISHGTKDTSGVCNLLTNDRDMRMEGRMEKEKKARASRVRLVIGSFP